MRRMRGGIEVPWARYDRWQTRLPSAFRFTGRELVLSAIVCLAVIALALAVSGTAGVMADVE
ncbi:MAG: hypothetical protein ACYC7H_14750, partial [Chloroflexota bacterium]